MPQTLSDIQITEISLVDNPANKGARVVFFKRDSNEQKEPTKMEYSNPMTGAIVNIAKAMVQHGFAPPSLERSDVYGAMVDGARTIAAAGETPEQSFARFVSKFEDGRALMVAYKKATGPDRKEKPMPAKRVGETPAMKTLNELATELCKREPGLTHAQAVTKIYTDPCPQARSLAAQERRERYSQMGLMV
jgi:hypothetical protein